ncbi:hypothetical protein GRI43_04820 [Altererythrobacter luteolus]|uniref:Uncharacterized protein n=1 Tax=Pontixanthobacter luteolus TaxID=295089 RepID=A0A6I4UXV6_9SPHN|nr:hypothetical protein [Pontixanthobacter luteolus]MXP46717.1 hypothetical protein [Pontixanthobacter luteolus]
MKDKEPDLVDDARTEIAGMAKQGMAHPSTKPVLAGAAIGALGGALLPVVTWPIGLAAGAGYALWNRIKK